MPEEAGRSDPKCAEDARRLVVRWHRVSVYGDYRKRVATLSALLGFKVVEEG